MVREVEQPRYPPPRDAARPIPRHPIHPLPPCSTSGGREAARSRGAEAGGEAREEAAELRPIRDLESLARELCAHMPNRWPLQEKVEKAAKSFDQRLEWKAAPAITWPGT